MDGLCHEHEKLRDNDYGDRSKFQIEFVCIIEKEFQEIYTVLA